ncbi:MAG: hypothetical protein LUD02_10530 [Tannerellaceae bacterium]|nr:hypothetical protein [Tannerellaceae bacterium]
MRNIREWYTLTINEQALYYELVFVCNEKRWVEYFPCSNKWLASVLNISERSLIRLRKRLWECGLISYRTGKGRRSITFYSLTIDLATGARLSQNIDSPVPKYEESAKEIKSL